MEEELNLFYLVENNIQKKPCLFVLKKPHHSLKWQFIFDSTGVTWFNEELGSILDTKLTAHYITTDVIISYSITYHRFSNTILSKY